MAIIKSKTKSKSILIVDDSLNTKNYMKKEDETDEKGKKEAE